MSRIRITVIGAALILVVVVASALQFRSSEGVSKRPSGDKKSGELDGVLQALVVSTNSGGTAIKREPIQARLKKRQEAVAKLRANPTAFLPQLLEEVYAVGKIEATNRTAAAPRTEGLVIAFEALGSEARPLLPKLKEQFQAGRSIGPCVAAFQYIGDKESGLILVSGLTNAKPLIHNACIIALSSFTTNKEVAVSALPGLLPFLKSDSQLSRVLAASALGSLRVAEPAAVRALVQVARTDPDFVVRVSAIKAIGRLGTNAVGVKSDLEEIARTDKEMHVRRSASAAIQAVNGEIPPNEAR